MTSNLNPTIANKILASRGRKPGEVSNEELADLVEAIGEPNNMSRALFVELSELEARLENTMPSEDEKAMEQDALLAHVLSLMDASPWILSGTGGCIERPKKYSAKSHSEKTATEFA